MNNKERLLAELQEISLWQQLNRQLHALKKKGKPIKKKDHEVLQRFCFKHSLFARITNSAWGNDLPLTLLTDFNRTFFITFRSRIWTNLLCQIDPTLYVLDLERAQANSLRELLKLNDKYHLVDKGDTALEDDKDLYTFVNKYLDKREAVDLDIPDMIAKVYDLKIKALKRIILVDNVKRFIKRQGQIITLDTQRLKKEQTADYNRVISLYEKYFLNKVESAIQPPKPMIAWFFYPEIKELLSQKLKSPGLKDSVRDFIKNELIQYIEEEGLLDGYLKTVRLGNRDKIIENKISICSIDPFFILKQPFPLV